MDKQIISKLTKNFEENSHNQDRIEFWYARDLQVLLGYVEWRKISNVIEKAKEACKNTNNNIQDHFVEVAKTINMPKGATKDIEDYKLTRYACYLIAQNGDPRKQEIAFAQSYFAIQTRKQELIEQRIALQERFEARNKLTAGFARIRSKGDEALFGGNDTKQMKQRLQIPDSKPLADFLPTVTIAAKNFATEITNFNVKQNDLQGEKNITGEHVKNNQEIRSVLIKNNIVPENLPPEEDIKKLEKKINKEKTKLLHNQN